jgi:hypothetical protein
MRTKVLALSALVGALGAASAIAQTNVYSINAVGYINLTLAPGFNMIACQLQTTNNTIGSLLNNASGIYDNCVVYKYNAANATYGTDLGDSSGSSYANGWDANGTITMNPGEAVWFKNAATSNLTATFVGTVPQGTNTVPIQVGFQMISSPVPFSGDLVTNMQLTNYTDKTVVFVWNNPATGQPHGGYSTYLVDLSGGSQGYKSQWDDPDPAVNVGQGFWYKSGAGTQTPWVQVFSINP